MDTVGGKGTDPQTLNLYAYVNNNPLRYNDPTGHTPQDLNFTGHRYKDNNPDDKPNLRPHSDNIPDGSGQAGKKPQDKLSQIREQVRNYLDYHPDLKNYSLKGDKGGNSTKHPDQKLVVVPTENAQLTITTRDADPSSVTVGAGKDANGNPIYLVLIKFNFKFILNRQDGSEIKDFTYTVFGAPFNAATDLDKAGNSPPVLSVPLTLEPGFETPYKEIIGVGGIETEVQFSTTSRLGAIEVNQGYNNRVSIPRFQLISRPNFRGD